MATFNLEQVFNLARTGAREREWLRWAARTDPHTLASNPQALATLLHWKSEVERLCQSPLVQQSITAQAPGLNIPSPRGMSVHDAARQGLYAQQPAQVQAPQVHRGAVAYVQQKPDPALQQAVRNVQRTLDTLPGRLAAAVQRSQARPAQVQRSQATAPAPQLPVSPFTGQPSSLTQMVRRSVGLDGGPTPPQAPLNPKAVEYYQQRQVAQQTQAQKAAYEASLPISPHTGQPSSLTQMVRRSVGL